MKKIYLSLVVLIAAIVIVALWLVPKSLAPNGITDKSGLIQVAAPTAGEVITSPVTISGRARGNWYFEASFPIKLLDANGKLLAIKPAQADGEWMTENFVPFSVNLEFEEPATDTGTLILEKDNPSGLPEHSAEIRIPIRFR